MAVARSRGRGRDVIVDEIGPRHSGRDRPIAGGDIDPGLPFLRRDIVDRGPI